MSKLFLLRHGESYANTLNIFSGLLDVGLTKKGISQAIEIGKKLKRIKFDEVYTSKLSRAFMTAMLILSENENVTFPLVHSSKLDCFNSQSELSIQNSITNVFLDERLNERFYGSLQGKTVEKGQEILGVDKSLWQLSFADIHLAENLEDTIERTKSFYDDILIPKLSNNKNLLVISHGTCMTALLTHIEKIRLEEMISNELPNSKPRIYSFENNSFKRDEL